MTPTRYGGPADQDLAEIFANSYVNRRIIRITATGRGAISMTHKAIQQVFQRVDLSRDDSDFTYFFDLLLAAEALAKTVTLGMVAAIGEDKERNRYRIEHALARSDGMGDWGRAIEDVLTGLASQYLVTSAHPEQSELTRLCRDGDWQYRSVSALKSALDGLGIESEELPVKSDMKRWFRLLSTLRNKTRAHGATRSTSVAQPAECLRESLNIFYENFSLFKRSWVYLHRNLSGKYRVSLVCGDATPFEYLKREPTHVLKNGLYIYWDCPRGISLAESDSDLIDFYFANGSFSGKKYELLSYFTDNKRYGDAQAFSIPPGTLPPSETDGRGELIPRGNCFSNAPESLVDYVDRAALEGELLTLLSDDKRPIITLRGRGGIGKTSLALRILEDVYLDQRYMTVVWLSARDVDLHMSGPKPVRPNVFSPDDMSKLYAKLVLSEETRAEKGFNARQFFEGQLQKSDSGPCLFVFDNFETTQNPLEVFTWIDTYIRLPNKALITTRLRDFKGDYPVDVSGMNRDESIKLINQVSAQLGIARHLTSTYVEDLIDQSEGHPYVIKILLGEVAKTGAAGNIPRLVAGSDEILTALFERTYASLTPCAQRAFLTLSAWNSLVPRLALEAVLIRSTGERQQVESGIEALINYSLVEVNIAPADNQEFLSLPLVASVFGKKKLNISPQKMSILSDAEILQMLGPTRRDGIQLGLAKRVERFVSAIAKRCESGESYEKYEPIIEMICRNYPQGWLVLARWHLEVGSEDGLKKARSELGRFLENEPDGAEVADAWRMLAFVCHRLGDTLGEVHAFVERAQLSEIPFFDVSNTANRLNQFLRDKGLELDTHEKQALAQRLATVMENRREEADSDDFSRMAWLAIHQGLEGDAQKYTAAGLEKDPDNYHCGRLARRLGLSE